jgi:hypothetical protein
MVRRHLYGEPSVNACHLTGSYRFSIDISDGIEISTVDCYENVDRVSKASDYIPVSIPNGTSNGRMVAIETFATYQKRLYHDLNWNTKYQHHLITVLQYPANTRPASSRIPHVTPRSVGTAQSHNEEMPYQ